MSVFSPQFIAFFLVALVLFWSSRDRAGVHLVAVLACNALFYCSAGIQGVAVLCAVCLCAWGFGRRIASLRGQERKRLALLAAFVTLSFLAFFKYAVFAFESVQSLCAWLGIESAGDWLAPDVAYVVGISFFSFQAVSYLVDIYRGTLANPLPLAQVAAYVSFFPTIMSGPILRAGEFAGQLGRCDMAFDDIRSGFVWILSGLFKKVVLASYLSEFAVRGVFSSPEGYSSMAVLLGVYAYAIQIYCDFSGYTDIAVGMGRLLGYRIPDNFMSPYLTLSVQDFWRRWHITLSLWLRDYLYFPLGGSRHGNVHVNLFLTMLIGGLWHGAAWTFIIWGALHGLALVVHRLWCQWCRRCGWDLTSSRLWKTLAWALTFHVVCVLWVFFRADNLEIAMAVFGRIADLSDLGKGMPVLVPAVIAAGLALQFARPLFEFACALQRRLWWALDGIAVAAIATVLMAWGPEGVLPFIYFGF